MNLHLNLYLTGVFSIILSLPLYGYSFAIGVHGIGAWGTYGCWPYAEYYEVYEIGEMRNGGTWGCRMR